MKILLSGAGGQLGSRLARDLTSAGEVIALSRQDLDLTESTAIARTIDAHRPDLIVNAAAYTAVDQAETDRDSAWAVNAVAPGLIGGAARACGAPVIHFSTDYVFDGTLDRPYRESDATNPVNYYGLSKRAGEEALLASGADALIFRVSWLYAEDGQNFMRTMLRLAIERETLDVVDDQTGAPTYVGAISEALTQLITQRGPFLGSEAGAIYHLACDGAGTWRDFAEAIVDAAGRNGFAVRTRKVQGIPTSAYKTPAQRPKNSRLDQTRVRAQFGLHLPHWRDALEQAMEKAVPVG